MKELAFNKVFKLYVEEKKGITKLKYILFVLKQKNKNSMMRWILFFFLSNIALATAQDVRISDEQVKIEGLFIDAKREKLLENYEKAEQLYKEVLKQDRRNDAAQYDLAQVYLAQKKYEESLQSIQKAIELNNTNAWYILFLAELYENQQQYAKVANIYERLVAQYPKRETYYFKWAESLANLSKPEEVVKVYEKLETQIGLNPKIVLQKHAIYVTIKDYKKAAAELQRLVDAFPKDTEYLHLLASFYIDIGDFRKADTTFESILKIDPNNPKALLANRGKKNESNNLLAKFKRVFEDSNVNIDLKIKEFIPVIQEVARDNNSNLTAEALQLSSILIQVHPNEAKAFAAHADLLYHSGQIEEAQKNYERTIALDETVYAVWEQLLGIYLIQKKYDQLAKAASDAIDIFPNQAQIYFLNGIALHQLGKYKQAVEVLEEALLMASGNLQLQSNINNQLKLSQEQLK